MAGEKKQVNVALDHDQYERWQSHVEENGRYATMSDLVRMSVEKELSRDDTQGSQVGGKEVAKVTEKVDSLENAIQGLSNDFQTLKGIVESQTPTNQNLKGEVFAALPEGGDDVHNPVTPEEVAAKIGGPIDTETVADILEELAQETGQVQSYFIEENGERIIQYDKKGE